MNALGMQVAFIVPFSLPVIGAATLHNQNWFYPACMVVVGAHYMPFIFSYGMWQFGILAAALIGGGDSDRTVSAIRIQRRWLVHRACPFRLRIRWEKRRP